MLKEGRWSGVARGWCHPKNEKKTMEESKKPGSGLNKEMLGDNNIMVECECGVFEVFVRTVNGKHNLIPNELICTKCKTVLKMKDFI